MTDQERLEIAVKALEEIKSLDGSGLDLSPPGPCYLIADGALHKIRTRRFKVAPSPYQPRKMKGIK